MKKYAKVVFVDQKELNSLPQKIRQGFNAAGNIMPLIVFLSPNSETSYGAFQKKALSSQKYNTIFRDVKKKIKAAKEEGQLRESGLVAKNGGTDSEGGNIDSDSVVIASPRIRIWKSNKGREIKAKLIKFEANVYHLRTTKGKTIKVTADDLDAATVKMAEEIVSINKQ